MNEKALTGAAIAIGLVAIFYSFKQDEIAQQKKLDAENAFSARVNAQLDSAEKKGGTPAKLSQQIVNIALAGNQEDGDAERLIENRYHKTVRQSAIEHIQFGYQQTDPISPGAYSRLALGGCFSSARIFEMNMTTFDARDVSGAWSRTYSDLQFWLPYVGNPDLVVKQCQAPFNRLMEDSRKRHNDGEKPSAAKDVGEAIGKVTSGIGKLWDQKTKPISDAVNGVVEDFKTGYSDATE